MIVSHGSGVGAVGFKNECGRVLWVFECQQNFPVGSARCGR